jgi:uncharacterized protein (DUF2384 family)
MVFSIAQSTTDREHYAEAPIAELVRSSEAILGQPDLGRLMGVSTQTLGRWQHGASPRPDREQRMRRLARVVDELKHSFTGPAGITAWLEAPTPGWVNAPQRCLTPKRASRWW